MGFSKSVAERALVMCGRRCCICNHYAGLSIELHHIKQKADGGDDSFENCIPLCCNCHAIVKAYNPHHPGGRAFTEQELIGHRDKCYRIQSMQVKTNEESLVFNGLFTKNKTIELHWGLIEQDKECPLRPGMLAMVAGYSGDGKSAYVQRILDSNLNNGMHGVYCCMKESPEDVAVSILSVAADLGTEQIRRGLLAEEDWKRLAIGLSYINDENLKLYDGAQFNNSADCIIAIVENSGADIIVIDDIGGVLLESNRAVEAFMYRLKRAAAKSQAVVFVVCNISKNEKRMDQRPMLVDFPTDSYYRICDAVHFIFAPSNHYDVEVSEKNYVEAIVVKGAGSVRTITMMKNDKTGRICSLIRSSKEWS